MQNDLELFMYKNEAYCSYSMAFVFNHSKEMSMSKAMLILPFFYAEGVLAKLSNQNLEIRSLEEFIAKCPAYIAPVSRMYKTTLTIGLNALMLLKELQKIEISHGCIEVLADTAYEVGMGPHLQRSYKASGAVAKILSANEAELFVNLRIVP